MNAHIQPLPVDTTNNDAPKNPGNPPNYLKPWKKTEYEQLDAYLRANKSFEEISELHGRTRGGIRAAVERLVERQLEAKTSTETILQAYPRIDEEFIANVVKKQKRCQKKAQKNRENKNENKNDDAQKIMLDAIKAVVEAKANIAVDVKLLKDILGKIDDMQGEIAAVKVALSEMKKAIEES